MFERNDDVLYICYDNGGYMNTGVQRSSATPPSARTATTMPVGPEPGNVFGQGKFVPAIAMAHEIPYVATATVADLRDLEYKVKKAMSFRGARYIQILVPCPLGWGAASQDTIRLSRLAKESGTFPVFEAEYGELTGSSKIRRRVPVEEYLKPQKRFAHLFGKTPAVLPLPVCRQWQTRIFADTNCSTRRPTDGQAVCNYTGPRLVACQPHGFVAYRTSGLCRPATALQQPMSGR